MSKLINADAIEKDGWHMSRIVQIDEKTMESQTRKPTDFPAVESQPKQQWILCSEILPEKYSNVLCCDTYGEYIIGVPFEDKESNTGFCAVNDDVYMIDCIAWMPLPEPYQKGKQDE